MPEVCADCGSAIEQRAGRWVGADPERNASPYCREKFTDTIMGKMPTTADHHYVEGERQLRTPARMRTVSVDLDEAKWRSQRDGVVVFDVLAAYVARLSPLDQQVLLLCADALERSPTA